jgi:hypothetical protein
MKRRASGTYDLIILRTRAFSRSFRRRHRDGPLLRPGYSPCERHTRFFVTVRRIVHLSDTLAPPSLYLVYITGRVFDSLPKVPPGPFFRSGFADVPPHALRPIVWLPRLAFLSAKAPIAPTAGCRRVNLSVSRAGQHFSISACQLFVFAVG